MNTLLAATPPSNQSEAVTGIPFDAGFLFKFICVISVGVILVILGFTVIGAIAFYRNQNRAADAFAQLFLRGEILRMLTVTGIAVFAVSLGFARIVDGAAVASILSGIAGYVLGGVGQRRAEKDLKEPHQPFSGKET